jgi:transposase InsO family protein
MLDVFSRYVVGWMVAHQESATLAEQRVAARAAVLATASGVHPERFPGGLPQPPARPTEVWITPPHAPSDRGGAPTLNLATPYSY